MRREDGHDGCKEFKIGSNWVSSSDCFQETEQMAEQVVGLRDDAVEYNQRLNLHY